MRYLVISDIHANLEALEAVLRDASGTYDAVLSIGDLVGYGPNPNEVVARVRALNVTHSLLGNHDLAALGRLDPNTFNPHARVAAEWTAAVMTPETRAYVASLEPSLQREDLALFHASPRDPVWEYMEAAVQGPPNFAAFEGPFAVVGHTHVPRVFTDVSGRLSRVASAEHGDTIATRDGQRRILNPGGVGQPRDGDARAAYALYDDVAGTFTFRRVAYDLASTQEKILAAGLPQVLAIRLAHGR
jgi:diadenosine tetraphosphatase ApaH/serine/threonine PP2A family protein phosphatase